MLLINLKFNLSKNKLLHQNFHLHQLLWNSLNFRIQFTCIFSRYFDLRIKVRRFITFTAVGGLSFSIQAPVFETKRRKYMSSPDNKTFL